MTLPERAPRRFRVAPLRFVFLAAALPVLAQEAGVLDLRYKVEVNQDLFPQKKPQDALKSVVKAVSEKRFGYLLAQLCLPATVDPRVLRIAETYKKGSLEDRKLVAFEEVIQITSDFYLKDPVVLRELRLFAAEAEWEEKDNKAVAKHKDLPGRKLIFQKLENRWFLENRSK
jgi:hypothetical protein